MRTLSFISIVVLQCAAGNVHASENQNTKYLLEIDSSWLTCSKTNDCAIVAGVCGYPAAVNRRFAKQLSRHLLAKAAVVVCNDFAPPEWPNHAACVDKQCSLTEKVPAGKKAK